MGQGIKDVDDGNGVGSSVPGGEDDKGLEDNDILRNPDSFYGRLAEFFDSTGLSLILNAREMRLDLFMFYKEVAIRGGFQRVNLEGKWSELVGAMSLEGEVENNEKLATQLQRLYANLLFQFEQSNMPRTTTRSSGLPGLHIANAKGTSMKRRSQGGENCPTAKKLQKKYVMSTNGVITTEQKSKSKNESKKDPMAPLGHRSPYQMFLKVECDRLRKLHGDNQEGKNTKKLALDAWRHLTNADKQSYIEASRTDKERYNREMKSYLEHLKTKTQETDLPTINPVGVYNVSLNQEDAAYYAEPQISLERAVEIAAEMLKTAPADVLLNLNWDDLCGSVHVSESD